MKRAGPAAAAMLLGFAATAAELQRDILAIDFAKNKGLVAAAYQKGQVVVWDFESGNIRHVFNTGAERSSLNQPIAHFSGDGSRLAYTAEGESGLIVYDLDQRSSTVLVPRRLLYLGIRAFSWSRQEDLILVAIGRDILLVGAGGQVQWKRRLETRSLITDVVWHPSEQSYTVATDDGTVSSYEAVSGRSIASSTLDNGGHTNPVKLAWANDGTALVAGLYRGGLVWLDPESLKPRKSVPCGCVDFDWSPAKKELAASSPPNIALFTDPAQRAREIRTPFEGAGPVRWVDANRILTAFLDAAVVLRDARSPKVLKTFARPASYKIQ